MWDICADDRVCCSSHGDEELYILLARDAMLVLELSWKSIPAKLCWRFTVNSCCAALYSLHCGRHIVYPMRSIHTERVLPNLRRTLVMPRCDSRQCIPFRLYTISTRPDTVRTCADPQGLNQLPHPSIQESPPTHSTRKTSTEQMPKDILGQTHAGSLGLFDDASEYDVTTARAERRERGRLEGMVRRHVRRDKRQFRKEQKTAKRAAQKVTKIPRLVSWFLDLFGRKETNSVTAAPSTSAGTCSDKGKRERYRVGVPLMGLGDFVIVRRPESAELIYTAEDVEPLDSPWLMECGMVRVRSSETGECHVVPKRAI